MPFGRVSKLEDGRVAVEVSAGRKRLALVGALAFALAGALGAVFTPSLPARVVFGLCAVLFGGVFMIGLRDVFRSEEPLLTVSPDGIETARVLVPWEEIERVGIVHMGSQEALAIWTKDPFYAARRGPWYLWPFAVSTRLLGFPPLTFMERAVPIDEVLAAIDRAWTSTSTRRNVALVQLER